MLKLYDDGTVENEYFQILGRCLWVKITCMYQAVMMISLSGINLQQKTISLKINSKRIIYSLTIKYKLTEVKISRPVSISHSVLKYHVHSAGFKADDINAKTP
jgi:hypothetical protein